MELQLQGFKSTQFWRIHYHEFRIRSVLKLGDETVCLKNENICCHRVSVICSMYLGIYYFIILKCVYRIGE